MYCKGASSLAEALTTVVYSIAPAASRVSTSWTTVDIFCPMAT